MSYGSAPVLGDIASPLWSHREVQSVGIHAVTRHLGLGYQRCVEHSRKPHLGTPVAKVVLPHNYFCLVASVQLAQGYITTMYFACPFIHGLAPSFGAGTSDPYTKRVMYSRQLAVGRGILLSCLQSMPLCFDSRRRHRGWERGQ